MGMSCVISVSLSGRERLMSTLSSRKESSLGKALPALKSSSSVPSPFRWEEFGALAAGVLDVMDVVMVSESRGTLSFLVNRIDAEMAF